MVTAHEPLEPVVQVEAESEPRLVEMETGTLAWLLDVWIVIVDVDPPTGIELGLDEMLKIFDEISIRTQFYYGRYDIKCQSIEDLRKKQNFTILEFNGSGAEPNHVYHAGYSLFDAYKVFLRHWKVLYEISKYNNQHGVPYWPLIKGWKFLQAAKKNLQLLEEKDKEILV